MKTLQHGEKGFNLLFIRIEADNYILLPTEFRLYAHLARRAGSHAAWPSVRSMAKKCRMHEDNIRRCLRRLRELNLIKAHRRPGATTLYTLTPLSTWVSPSPEDGSCGNPPSIFDEQRKSGITAGKRTLIHGENGFNILFIRSELDDYILTPTEFRLYAHLARKAGSDGAWPSVQSMAMTCRMHEDTVRRCLRRLKELNLVKAQIRPGHTTLYILTPYKDWKPSHPSEDKGPPLLSEGLTPPKPRGDSPLNIREGTPPKVRGTKVSQEGNPLKDTTVAGPAIALPPPPNGSVTASHHAAWVGNDSKSAFKPGVSLEEKPFRQTSSTLLRTSPPFAKATAGRQGKSLIQWDSRMTISGNGKGSPIQTPIKKKAYAVAGQLFRLHWDNCKVGFHKEKARAYAECALQDGHDEQAILKAYDKSLRYCHGLATDQILDGKLHRYEKAKLLLTVSLARQRLDADPRTLEERWKVITSKINGRKQKAFEEEEKIWQETTEKAPEISAWFAQRREAVA